jgi:hypothetical protein
LSGHLAALPFRGLEDVSPTKMANSKDPQKFLRCSYDLSQGSGALAAKVRPVQS